MLGFNQEVYHLNHELHVQTEASPYEDRFQIVTHLFYKGLILATEKQIVLSANEEELQKEIHLQHVSFVKKITQGKYNQEIELKAPTMSAQQALAQYEYKSTPQIPSHQTQIKATSSKPIDLDPDETEGLYQPLLEISGLNQSLIKYLIKQSKI